MRKLHGSGTNDLFGATVGSGTGSTPQLGSELEDELQDSVNEIPRSRQNVFSLAAAAVCG